MKRALSIIILSTIFILGITTNATASQPTQESFKKTIRLSEKWMKDHYHATLNGDLFEVTLTEYGYDDVEMELIHQYTGVVFKLKKGDLRRSLNTKDLPRGIYTLKIKDELIFESNTEFKLK